jgi:hypothetical protein
MAYPDDALGMRLELLVSGDWTDITDRAWPDTAAANTTLTWGQPAAGQAPVSLSLPVTLDNSDGYLTPGNLASPWYPQIGVGTLARLSVAGETLLRTDEGGFATCPDSSALHAAGDIDARADCMLSDWSQPAVIIGKIPSWQLQLDTGGLLQFQWLDNGSVNWTAACTVQPQPGRCCLRAVLDVSAGIVTFYRGPAGGISGGTWAQLGDPVDAGSGATTVATTGPLFAGDAAGLHYEAQVSISGTTVAHPVFSGLTPAATSFTDGQGNAWTVESPAEVTDRDYLAHGSIASITAVSSSSGTSQAAATVIGGPLRVQAQGARPVVISPIRRAIAAQPGTLAPVQYWPCEDGAGSPSLASVTGGAPVQFDGSPQLAIDSTFTCSAPLPQLGTSRWHGRVPAYSGAGSVVVRFPLKVGTLPGSKQQLVRLTTTGTATEVTFSVDNSGFGYLAGANSSGSVFSDGPFFALSASSFSGTPGWMSIELRPSGGTVDVSLVMLTPGGASGFILVSDSFTGTVGRLTDVYVNTAAAFSDTVIGHMSVQADWVSMFSLQRPLDAWAAEPAGQRFARVCGENGLAARVIGAPSLTALMGPQPIASAGAILAECAAADGGVEHEAPGAYAMGYRTLASMLNQDPALSLDASGGEVPGSAPPQPLTSDDGLVTDYTAQSADGTSARVTAEDWTGVPYPDSGVFNVATAVALLDVAGMQVMRGIVSPRYPQLACDLGLLSSDQAATAARVRAGDVVKVTGLPATTDAAGTTRQVIPGGSVTLGPGRRMTWAAVPAAAYDTIILDDPVAGRLDSDVVTLHASITGAATSVQVDVAGVLITTDAGDFPVDLAIGAGGERITATACSGTSSPQTLTVTRGTPSRAWAAGTPVRLWRAPRYAPL